MNYTTTLDIAQDYIDNTVLGEDCYSNSRAEAKTCTDKFLKLEAEKFTVKFEVLDYFGPGGGNPYIRVTGTKENLEKYLIDGYCGGDKDDAQFYLDDIKQI